MQGSFGWQTDERERDEQQPFIEGGRRLAKESKLEEKGKERNEAECGDCDAFRSGAALTILLLPTSILIRSFTYFYPLRFARDKKESGMEETWKLKTFEIVVLPRDMWKINFSGQ